MFILYVKGDDYAAMTFEENYDPECIYHRMVAEGQKVRVLGNDDECYIEVELLEFNDVDEDFFHFVKYDMMDYDAAKHENIYRVG